MPNTKTQKMSMAASLVIVFLTFGAFAGAAAIVTKNQFSLAPTTLADDNEDGGGDSNADSGDDNSGDSKDSSSSESEKKKAEKASEATKKQVERERESAKKQLERSNDGFDDNSSDDNNDNEDINNDNNGNDIEDVSNSGDDDGDNNGGENDGDSDDDGNTVEGNNGDSNAMYQDRNKTLSKLQEKIDEARKEITQKRDEGFDVTAALARLALAEAAYNSVAGAFDANNLDEVKRLAKETRKLAHLAREDDLHGAEQEAESKDHRSEVADFAKSLNDVADIEEGSVGKQVRTIARAQKLSAEKVASFMDDAQNRSALMEFLIGPKTDDLDGIQNEISANTARIVILNRAITQVEDVDVKAMLSEQVAVLQQETTKLQSFVNSQANKSGLFSWLSAFFPKA